MEINVIICPIDFSEASMKALEYASLFTERLKSELILLNVIDDSETNAEVQSIPGVKNIPGSQDRLINQKLEAVRGDIEKRYGINIRTRIEYGDVADNIAKVGNETQIDLIVMGTSGASSVAEVFKATNTIRVIEKSICPVLVVPEQSEIVLPTKWLFASALDDEFELMTRNINSLSRAFEAQLKVLNVSRQKTIDNKISIGDDLQDKTITLSQIKNKNILDGINEFVEETNPDLLIVVEHPHKKWDWLFKEDKISRIVEGVNFPVLVLQG